MFTGLVEGLGRIENVWSNGPGRDLLIVPPAEMTADSQDRAQIGDSVAINGCCLTIVELNDRGWRFQAGSETLSRTNLGELQVGSAVNLERSLKANARLGGHFVQGHVDGLGRVEQIITEGDWVFMWFRVPESLTRQMVSKGSVCVDGVSLTLVEVETEQFSVALIPHTLQVTTLGRRGVGDAVNIETDIIGKYLEKFTRTGLLQRD